MLLTTLEAVHSHRLFLQGDLTFGIAHLKLHLELAEALTRVEAYLAGRSVIEDSDVNDSIALVYQAAWWIVPAILASLAISAIFPRSTPSRANTCIAARTIASGLSGSFCRGVINYTS